MTNIDYLVEKERKLEDELDSYIEDTPEYIKICDSLDDIRDELISLGF